MNIPMEAMLLVGAVLVFCSILISKTGYRFGIPTLLMFLVAGMLAGSDGLGLQFHNAYEAQIVGMIALNIILFTGGMDTQMKEIRPVLFPGIALSTLGVLLTTVITGLFIFGISQWEFTEIEFTLIGSLLLAATMSSTDSASVFNILRSQHINLKHNLRPMLELESGSNDPMAYLLTILLIQYMQSGDISGWDIALSFLLQFIVGGLGGYLIGRLTVWIINHIRLNNTELYSVLVLCFIFIIYCAVYLLKGNGYLAVYIAGIVIGNSHLFKKKEIRTFLDGITWLFQIVMFLTLGLLVNPHEMLSVTITALLISVFMILVARPASVWISLLPFGKSITTKSKWFISWVGLRGAAPILFATYPVVEQVEGSNQIFNIVFFVTILSLIVQGMTLTKAANLLKLSEPQEEKKDFFGIEFPDDLGSTLHEITCTGKLLQNGNHIKDIPFPKGMLVMMIKRGDQFIVPNGSVELKKGDTLLLISEDHEQAHAYMRENKG